MSKQSKKKYKFTSTGTGEVSEIIDALEKVLSGLKALKENQPINLKWEDKTLYTEIR